MVKTAFVLECHMALLGNLACYARVPYMALLGVKGLSVRVVMTFHENLPFRLLNSFSTKSKSCSNLAPVTYVRLNTKMNLEIGTKPKIMKL